MKTLEKVGKVMLMIVLFGVMAIGNTAAAQTDSESARHSDGSRTNGSQVSYANRDHGGRSHHHGGWGHHRGGWGYGRGYGYGYPVIYPPIYPPIYYPYYGGGCGGYPNYGCGGYGYGYGAANIGGGYNIPFSPY